MTVTIRNPLQWGVDGLGESVEAFGAANHSLRRPAAEYETTRPRVRRIGLGDLGIALRLGLDDFLAARTDVLFIGLIYPLAGLMLWAMTLHENMIPLLFPLTAGFALMGPFLALGLYELSRRREAGEIATWEAAMGAFATPSGGAILRLGLILTALFAAWLLTAMAIYASVYGWETPTSLQAFAEDVLGTRRGGELILYGCGAGFLFALAALSISVISFPLLLDRKLRVRTAIAASVRAVLKNPVPMLAWGALVAVLLVLGSLPMLLGLILVLPILGHATWHLYRRVIV